MKGKLIKQETHYHLVFDKEIVGSTHKIIADKYKLSLKNCEAIANGYDLDELAESLYLKSGPDGISGTLSFKIGFKKALEILGDKKFSEEDVIKCMKNSYGIKYFSEHKMIENLKSFQQTEWDVTFNPNEKDSDGCLILKRL